MRGYQTYIDNFVTAPEDTATDLNLPAGVYRIMAVGYVNGAADATLTLQIYTDSSKTAAELRSTAGTVNGAAQDIGAITVPNSSFGVTFLFEGEQTETSQNNNIGQTIPVPYDAKITFTEVSALTSANVTIIAMKVG